MSLFRLAVCGLHLRGQPLNKQLTDLSAVFVKSCESAPIYRLFAIHDPQTGKTKPGMVRPLDQTGCGSVYLEVWEMPVENFGHFMNLVPAPLGIGTVELDDGDVVKGFICEAWVKDAALSGDSNCTEITHLGGWLPFVEGNQEK